MRRKIIVVSLLNMMIQKGYSQQNVGDVVTTSIASPSMAAISKYADVPVSLSSGIPEIGIPLLDAPLLDGSRWPMSLSYNVQSMKDPGAASDVGAGWSFFGAGMIYKKIINDLDECYDNASSTNYQKNEFDDIYYYNLPGLSGKFRIKRDTINNTFTLINLTPNHAKIEFVRNSNTATFKADSFTITADNGYRYVFTDYDAGRYACGEFFWGFEYKTAYYLTQVLNPIGIETAAISYDKKTKYRGTNLIFQQNKIKAITSRKGQVAFDYVYDETLENKDIKRKASSDPYSLQEIYLKNPAGETLYSYTFNYTMLSVGNAADQKKRILNSVMKNDKSGNLIEKNTFVYEQPSGEGILKKMVSPTGGVAEYTYEPGELYFNFNDPAFLAGLEGASEISYPAIQYTSSMTSGTINTTQSLLYTFNIPGNQQVKKNFKFILKITDFERPDPPPPPLKPKEHNLKITLKRGTEIIIPSFIIKDNLNKEYKLNAYPGNYTLEIVRTGEAKANGTFNSTEIKVHPGPFRNSKSSAHTRLKNIKYYKNINDATAQRTINYNYDSFDLPDSASGYVFDNEKDSEDEARTNYTLYKNIKVSEAGKGSIRHSFKTPDDYPKQQRVSTGLYTEYFWPYYSITKAGLLSKKETYDEQNTLLTTELYDYELDHFSNEEYSFMGSYKIISKPAYIKKNINISRALYASGRKLESQSETLISNVNLKPLYTKSVMDGDTFEKGYTYPEGQAGFQNLVNAYMTGIPVIVEEKKNGKTLSKAETKYNNSSLLMPTSIWKTNMEDSSVKEAVKFDTYDDRGNLLQMTSAAGVSTVFVYGYNKTQIIAKIEGAQLSDIPQSAINTIVNASNDDNIQPQGMTAQQTELNLITALDTFRKNSALINYTVTTYTYDPLLGVTSTTPPSGIREVYIYDTANRLKEIRQDSKTGNLVKEFKYNYKN